MKAVKKILHHVNNPYFFIYTLIPRKILNMIPDKPYLKLAYHAKTGKKLNLKEPKSFNEKLQWIKLYDHKDQYITMVDKYAVKQYVADRIGDEYIIPTYGIWDSFEDIDFSKLPEQFVLKCTHDSGGLIICKDKKQLNIDIARKKIENSLKTNYFYFGREWPYKAVKPRVIAEKYMEDETGGELRDYKVLCFAGTPKLIELHQGRFSRNQTQDIYDTEWNRTNITQNKTSSYKESTSDYPKPAALDEMLRLSSILSEGIPHLRVDWYSIGKQLYFGELTFFDGSGFDPWDNYEDELLLGSWIPLP